MMMTSETSADKLAFVTGIGEIGGYAEQAAQEAVREAERVMAEAGGEFVGVPLSAHATRYPQGEAMLYSAFDGGFGAALAERLAAVLTVLDEMAIDGAAQAISERDETLGTSEVAAMWRRNRATLAGMEADNA